MYLDIILLSGTADKAGSTGGNLLFYILSVVIMLALFYVLLVRPEKIRRKKQEEMFKIMEVGDVVVTTCGFYGVLIDITEDDVIVEFGSNKNCRIPMKKTAIAEVEKADK